MSSHRLCILLLILMLFSGTISNGEPFVPQNGQQVVEKLRAISADASKGQMRALRAALFAEPTNSILAARYVRRCLEECRAEGDPRFLGRAQAALAPWWSVSLPPVELLVLRATLKQSQHDFEGALLDLDRAVRAAPANGQAWLTRVTILTVQGRYAEARAACVPLAQLAPGLVSITAAASVRVLSGDGDHVCNLLRRTLDQNPGAPLTQRQWALTILAETRARLGQPAAAEACFREALSLAQHDAYLLGAYSDFLLDEGRAGEVVDRLAGDSRSDALLLRLAFAEFKLKPGSAVLNQHVQTLRARFEENRLRGENVHRREEARFTLHLLGEPKRAVQLALSNWQVQREPADLRILLESALAARDSAAAQTGLDFLNETHLEDVSMTKLARELKLFASR